VNVAWQCAGGGPLQRGSRRSDGTDDVPGPGPATAASLSISGLELAARAAAGSPASRRATAGGTGGRSLAGPAADAWSSGRRLQHLRTARRDWYQAAPFRADLRDGAADLEAVVPRRCTRAAVAVDAGIVPPELAAAG